MHVADRYRYTGDEAAGEIAEERIRDVLQQLVDNGIAAHDVLECGLLSDSQRGSILSSVQAYMPELLTMGRSGDELDTDLRALQDEFGLSGMSCGLCMCMCEAEGCSYNLVSCSCVCGCGRLGGVVTILFHVATVYNCNARY